jgi:signal peptidase II
LQTRLSAIGAGLIIGGAVGNVTDRLHYGAVADFFSFHVAGFQWYIFNLADVAIVAGVAGLLYDSFVSSHKSAGKQA